MRAQSIRISRKRAPGRDLSTCKGPEVGVYPVAGRSDLEVWFWRGTAVGYTGYRESRAFSGNHKDSGICPWGDSDGEERVLSLLGGDEYVAKAEVGRRQLQSSGTALSCNPLHLSPSPVNSTQILLWTCPSPRSTWRLDGVYSTLCSGMHPRGLNPMVYPNSSTTATGSGRNV